MLKANGNKEDIKQNMRRYKIEYETRNRNKQLDNLYRLKNTIKI